MAITITLVSSTIEDPTTHFDLTIDGDVVATVTRSLSNANLKTLIEAAYDKGGGRRQPFIRPGSRRRIGT